MGWLAALAVLLGVALMGVPATPASAAVPAAAPPKTFTFDYTGAEQIWTVPAGATRAAFDVYGAEGGAAKVLVFDVLGGKGGHAANRFTVSPGEQITIMVGGKGPGETCDLPIHRGESPGGFNGGGNGGRRYSNGSCTGAAGGGASDVRIGGTGLVNRVLVAGGGGGASGNFRVECGSATGGAGGGLVGDTGRSVYEGCQGGSGGDQVGSSGSGQLGSGSPGYEVACANCTGGGGGGGGYYGGAGSPVASGGGGGGSGYGPRFGTTFETGVRSGNGFVTVTVDNPPEITLIKKVVNGQSGGDAGPRAWTLQAIGSTVYSGRTGDPDITNRQVAAGAYRLAEGSGPGGYLASAWSCAGGSLAGVVLTLAEGDQAVCTITNTAVAPRLTLVKRVDNGGSGRTTSPAAWTLSATGPVTISGRSEDPAVTNATVVTGSYQLAESGGPPGYDASGWTCTAGTLSGNTVTLELGANVTCTVTNTAVRVTPTIRTTPSPTSGGPVGTPVRDTADISSSYAPAGTVTFSLYGPADPNCQQAPVGTWSAALIGGTASSGSYATNQSGVYHWVVAYGGDVNNQPIRSGCQEESQRIAKVTPSIATQASPGGVVGTSITDAATVSGGYRLSGTVDFRLYGPDDATCSQPPVGSWPQVPVGTGTASSGGYPTAAAGVYRWVANYSGDDGNNPVSSGCEDEPVTLGKAVPTIATTPSPGGVVGVKVEDAATLSGGFHLSGDVTFTLYQPGDPTCSGTPLSTSTAPVLNGVASSVTYVTTEPGAYHWVADYSGDGNNTPATSTCIEEPAAVATADPTIATTPSAAGPVGSSISDTATVSGGYRPTGTVTFSLFGPGDPACSGPTLYTSTSPLQDGANSGSYATAQVGTYRWKAAYNGDSNNNPVTSSCTSEPVTTQKATPAITTQQSPPNGAVGTAISDTTTISGGFGPTGTVRFAVFAPADPNCSRTPAATMEAGLSNAGTASSGPVPTTVVGSYHWTASYLGDNNNNPVNSACNAEPVTITNAEPTLDGIPSAGGTVGTPISDTASLAGGFNPTGTISFALYAPADTHCTDNLVAATSGFTGVPLVHGKATSPQTITTATGAYQWVSSYSGDANNATRTGTCGDPNQQVTITAAPTPSPTPSPPPSTPPSTPPSPPPSTPPSPTPSPPPSPPPSPSSSSSLALTGGNQLLVMIAGGLLSSLGAMLLLASHRRRLRPDFRR